MSLTNKDLPAEEAHWLLKEIAEQKAEIERLHASFKNFHRLLCERFGYGHDDVDWERDQLSLIEWIAKRAAAEPSEPRHTTEENFQHFLAYSNLKESHALRWAFYAGKGEPPPGKSDVRAPEVCGCPYGQCHCDDGSERTNDVG